MTSGSFWVRGALVGALAGMGLVACDGYTTAVPPSPLSVSVDPRTTTLTAIGATARITAQVGGGADGTVRTVTWSSSNRDVATVDGAGLVTAVSNGSASIVATATANPGLRDTARVTVQVTGQTDADPPTVQFDAANTIANNTRFAATPALAQYLIAFNDAGSGFPTSTPLRVIEIADTGGGAGQVVCVLGSGPDCMTPVERDGHVPVDGIAGTQQGYVTMAAYAVDRAGNRSSTLFRTVLVDHTEPIADSVSLPAGPPVGGTATTFRAWLHDNLVMANASAQLAYSVLFAKALPTVELGSYGEIVKRAPADFADPLYIRAFRFARFPEDWVRPAALLATVTDIAGNASTHVLPLPPVLPPAPATDPFAHVTGGRVTVGPDSVSLSAQLTVDSDTVAAPPNAQVQFYAHVPGGDALVAVANQPTVTVNATLHVTTFAWTATASRRVSNASLIVMFLTADGIGLCLQPPAPAP